MAFANVAFAMLALLDGASIRQSAFSVMAVPAEFATTLLVTGLILAVAPFAGGADFGVVKIPNFSETIQRRLKVIGPLILSLVIFGFVPVWRVGAMARGTENAVLAVASLAEDSIRLLQATAIGRLEPVVRDARRSNGACRSSLSGPESRVDPWNTAQCVAALMTVRDLGSSKEDEFRKSYDYLAGDGSVLWSRYGEEQKPSTEVSAWVGLAFAESPTPLERTTRIYEALSRRQSSTGGWGSFATTYPSDDATGGYATHLALMFMLRLWENRAEYGGIDSTRLQEQVRAGLRWMLSRYSASLKGWEDVAGEGIHEDLGTLYLVAIARAKGLGLGFVESDPRFREARSAWLRTTESKMRDRRGLGSYLKQQQNVYDSLKSFVRVDYLTATVVWHPWSLLLSTYFSQDGDLSASERQTNSVIRSYLWRTLPRTVDEMSTGATFAPAELLYVLGMIRRQ